MKKLAISVFAVLFMASFAAAEVGIGIKAGGGEDTDNIKSVFISNPNNYSEETNNGILGLEVLWQQEGLFNLPAGHFLGAKAGVDFHGQVEYEDYSTNDKMDVNIYKFPVTLYYKYALPETQLNIWGGAGVTAAKINWEYTDMTLGMSAETDNTKVYPHIKCGVEWRSGQLFGLGLDLGYNFGGKFDKGVMKRDISGFEGALAARFYFL